MGQSSSKLSGSHPSSSSQPSTQTSSSSPTSSPAPSRSVRRRILHLVTPWRGTSSELDVSQEGHQNDDSGPSGDGHRSRRKQWRTSRRLSKRLRRRDSAQKRTTHPVQEDVHTTPVTVEDVERSTDLIRESPQSSASISSGDKPSDLTRQMTPSSSAVNTIALESRGVTESAGPSRHETSPAERELNEPQLPGSEQEPQTPASSSLAQRLGICHTEGEDIEASDEEVVIRPPTYPLEPSPAPTEPPPIITQTQPSGAAPSVQTPVSPQPRQFPPAGTLVVVQGVVHTTDVQRPPELTPTPALQQQQSQPPSLPLPATPLVPSSASRRTSLTPPATPSSSTRNRLSALIPRPSSFLGRPASRAGDDSGSNAASSSSSSQEASTSTTALETPADSTLETQPNAGPTGARSTPEPNPQTDAGIISSSSIDVLGTLLSVAAAATAASLLTGSSEPIFSSGLPTGDGSPENQRNAAAETNRPMSPTPTSGLGMSLAPLGLGHGHSHAEHPAHASHRVRSAWGSLRERLGLRSSANANTTNPASGLGSPRTPTAATVDPREHILSEMARAFNLGLGFGSEGAMAGGQDAEQQQQPQQQHQPQQQSQQASESAPERVLPPANSFERFLFDLQADLRVALSAPPPVPVESGPLDGQEPNVPGEPSAGSSQGQAGEVHPDDNPPAVEDGDAAVTPEGNAPVVDSETETNNAAPQPSTEAPRAEHRPVGGVNWWRMYRFPVITTPQTQGLASTNPASEGAANVATAQAQESVATSPSFGAQSPSSSMEASTSQASAPPPPPSSESPQMNAVVPVILVGLQSVPIIPRQPHDHLQTSVVEESNGEVLPGGEDGALEGSPSRAGEGGEDPSRGRTWGSRAANALRSMRSGRRGAERGTQLGAIGASRTFMIYVVGGYYPPDHHMATGSTNLDSFEALWELAELLGQVKPPTVTKEDIDKSGLEIIKPSQLEQYEKEGKVASSCVDRCLVCLDDYGSDDDLRLMGCRHTFHKDCVDRWLQTGRNNCPACRTKGVSTDEVPSPPSVSPLA